MCYVVGLCWRRNRLSWRHPSPGVAPRVCNPLSLGADGGTVRPRALLRSYRAALIIASESPNTLWKFIPNSPPCAAISANSVSPNEKEGKKGKRTKLVCSPCSPAVSASIGNSAGSDTKGFFLQCAFDSYFDKKKCIQHIHFLTVILYIRVY